MISTGNEGATIKFDSMDFPSIIAQSTAAPAPTALILAPVRRAQGGDVPVAVVEVPRKRTSIFERLSAPETPAPKRRVTGQTIPLVPMGTPTLLPTESFAPGRYDTEASSSGVKLFRRQRRKMNVELRSQQLSSEVLTALENLQLETCPSRAKPSRRQRRKMNVELRAQQLLSESPVVPENLQLEVNVPIGNKFENLRWVKRNSPTAEMKKSFWDQ